jgi:hypothetical protein
MENIQTVKQRFQSLEPFLDERRRRLLAGSEASAIGYGGITAVSRALGMSRRTVLRGVREMDLGKDDMPGRVRKPGGGRKPAKAVQPGLLDALRKLVEPATRGDPETPLRWVSKGARKLSKALGEQGFTAGRTLVGKLLHQELKFNLQANSKVLEGSHHPDRNAQFEHIAACIAEFTAEGQPVVSVDAKKERVGRGIQEQRS